MDAHGIHVFDEADGDLVALLVPDHFELQLFPADDALLDEDLPDEAGGQTPGDDLAELFHVVDDAAAGAAHGVGRTQDHGISQFRGDLFRLFHGVAGLGFGHGDPQAVHGFLELDPVFAPLDAFEVHADDFHMVLVEDARVVERGGKVEGGLAAQSGQQGVGPFPGDDPGQAVHGQGLDVGVIGHAGVGHDGRGVGVDQHHLVSFAPERLARLRA